MSPISSHRFEYPAAALLWVASLSSAFGATEAASAKGPSPGLFNEQLRQAFPEATSWDVGGQFRVRYEARANAGAFPNNDFVRDKDGSNDALLERLRYHIGYKPNPWVSVYAEGRSSFEQWDKRHPSPEPDAINLRQAYIALGDAKQFPLTTKVGRQELLYGEERFIGIGDWSNTGRTFDAFKLRWSTSDRWLDAFTSRVVIPTDGQFAVSNDYDSFSGLYGSLGAIIPWQETQAYVLARNVSPQAPNAIATGVPGTPTTARDVYTVGVRMVSLPKKLHGWDYTLEADAQMGSINQGSFRRNQESFAVFASGGFTWESAPTLPRLGLGYEFGTGDSDPTDNKNQTFENLFGTNHRFYGAMDLFSQRNMQIPRVAASFKPVPRLTLSSEILFFVLTDTHDFLYPESGSGRNQNGFGRHPELDPFVGTEVDVIATYALPKLGDIQVGYGHFFTGSYISQSIESIPGNGGATDADWFYAQVRFNF